MNWIITTRIPYPTARTAMPRHEVVFPFPLPVRTRTSPRRGFSGIRSTFLLAIASPFSRSFPPHKVPVMMTEGEPRFTPRARGPRRQHQSRALSSGAQRGRAIQGGRHDRAEAALHGLREGKGIRGPDLRGVQGDDPRRGLGKGEEDQTAGRAGDPPGGDPPQKVTGEAATRSK